MQTSLIILSSALCLSQTTVSRSFPSTHSPEAGTSLTTVQKKKKKCCRVCREQEMLYAILSIFRLEARNIPTLQRLIDLETLLC